MPALVRLTMLVAVLGCSVALGACGARSPAPRLGCLPSRLRVDPPRVKAGGIVEVSSPRFACRGSYPVGHRYTLILGQVGRAAPVRLGAFPVGRDGAFSAMVRIPDSASPGGSYIIVMGSPFDDCAESGGAAASCAGYDVPVAVTR